MNNEELFFIPVDGSGSSSQSLYIAYAPLYGSAAIVTEAGKDRISSNMSIAEGRKSQCKENARFFDMRKRSVQSPPKCIADVYEIDILANYTCNFNCVYCYSARGRSNRELKYETAVKLLDYIFNENHRHDTRYKINFSGGGEPLMSFGLIKRLVEYIEKKALKSRHEYVLQMVTNGSLLTKEYADFFKMHNINIIVSFAILKKHQEGERSSYYKVAGAIDMLIENGNRFGIRATITDKSVGDMAEMVEEMHKRFPRLKAVVFDTVLSRDMFKDANSLKEYYDAFLNGFYVARSIGEKLNIGVYSTAVQLLDYVRTRACLGKMVLTPLGDLSICARISSPKEKEYVNFIYGHIDEKNGITTDEEKFSSWMDENTIETDECRKCYARWHCGGGCRLFRCGFDSEAIKIDCEFKRTAVRSELLKRLETKVMQLYGMSLNEYFDKLKS